MPGDCDGITPSGFWPFFLLFSGFLRVALMVAYEKLATFQESFDIIFIENIKN